MKLKLGGDVSCAQERAQGLQPRNSLWKLSLSHCTRFPASPAEYSYAEAEFKHPIETRTRDTRMYVGRVHSTGRKRAAVSRSDR